MVANAQNFRIVTYKDAARTIPKTEIDHPLNSCLPSTANVGEFLQVVHHRDERKKVQYLTKVTMLTPSALNYQLLLCPETFSLLPCKVTSAEPYMLVPNLNNMTPEEIKEL
jgi:hypothetical protein